MEWKYRLIFLLLLLCLACSEKSFAQQCVYFNYDKSGNRTEMYEGACGSEYKNQTREMMDLEMLENENESHIVSIYPNPNDGAFKVVVDDDVEMCSAVFQVYNDKGVLIISGNCINNQDIDISDNPAGVYLLRIIKGEYVCSKVVVKL